MYDFKIKQIKKTHTYSKFFLKTQLVYVGNYSILYKLLKLVFVVSIKLIVLEALLLFVFFILS